MAAVKCLSRADAEQVATLMRDRDGFRTPAVVGVRPIPTQAMLDTGTYVEGSLLPIEWYAARDAEDVDRIPGLVESLTVLRKP